MRLGVPVITRTDRAVRVEALLETGDRDHPVESLWFRTPADREIDRGCGPFLPVALLLATAAGASVLEVEGPVSETLLAGAAEAADFLAAHFATDAVHIEAPSRPDRPGTPGRAVGLFFSRGVDSTTNLLLAERGESPLRADLAIVLTGIDPLDPPDVAAAVSADTAATATSMGLEPLVVATNLRDVTDRTVEWVEAHGLVLAGAGLLLAPEVEACIISSGVPDLAHYEGSHPALDRLWTDGRVTFHHLPDRLLRSERVALIASDPRALGFLRVCYGGATTNCGRCQKCLQTAAMLAAHGHDPTPLFDDTDVSAEDIRRRGPGRNFRRDFAARLGAAGMTGLADAAAEDPDVVAGRVSRARLAAAAAAAAPARPRPLDWLAIGEPGPRLAALADAFAPTGPGAVLADGAATHVEGRIVASAGRTAWWLRHDETDRFRTIDCIGRGSRPVLVVEPGVEDEVRRTLPTPVASLVVSLDSIGDRDARRDEPPLDVVGAALSSGAVGWLGSNR